MYMYSWHWEIADPKNETGGGYECDPPEPTKSWICICDADGEEMAVIICRDYHKVKEENPKWIEGMEDRANIIVGALNNKPDFSPSHEMMTYFKHYTRLVRHLEESDPFVYYMLEEVNKDINGLPEDDIARIVYVGSPDEIDEFVDHFDKKDFAHEFANIVRNFGFDFDVRGFF